MDLHLSLKSFYALGLLIQEGASEWRVHSTLIFKNLKKFDMIVYVFFRTLTTI
jgi:hypothetical protein